MCPRLKPSDAMHFTDVVQMKTLEVEMEKRFLSVVEVGEVLGVSRTAAYGLVKEGILPSVRMAGSSTKVPVAALDEYARQMEVEATRGRSA